MKILLISFAVLVVLGGGFLLFQKFSTSYNPTSTTQSSFCNLSQLQGTAAPDVAAGNVYVTVTIKNTSQTRCEVIGNNTLEVGYPNSVTNFQVVTKGQPSTPVFTLEPNQTIYSLVHYPNGPQCSSQATGVDSMISYNISQTNSLTFNPTNATTISIPSCGNASEVTTIEVYPFSSSSVTP